MITKGLMQQGIKVDSWGQCSGKYPDEKLNKEGPEKFFSKYRFYFSFENSLCDDYVTEKGFQGLYYGFLSGMIPITYGLAKYDEIFPPNSYINANDFSNIEQLANYLKKLSALENAGEIAKYYQWHRTALYEPGFEYDKTTKLMIRDHGKYYGWHNLCERLWREDNEKNDNHQFTSIIKEWNEELGKCIGCCSKIVQRIDHNDLLAMFQVAE